MAAAPAAGRLETATAPLRIRVAPHPCSSAAWEVAGDLYARFMHPASTPGLRVPVLFTPARDDGARRPVTLDDDEAPTLLVVLIDAVMARRVAGGAGALWARWLRDLLDAHPPGAGRHAALAIALDPPETAAPAIVAGFALATRRERHGQRHWHRPPGLGTSKFARTC